MTDLLPLLVALVAALLGGVGLARMLRRAPRTTPVEPPPVLVEAQRQEAERVEAIQERHDAQAATLAEVDAIEDPAERLRARVRVDLATPPRDT